MGQKVHPTGFRLGFNKTWNSIWWASCNYNGYTHLLKEDFKIQDYVLGSLRGPKVTTHLPKIYRQCGNIYILLNFNFIKIKKKKRRFRSRFRLKNQFKQNLKKNNQFQFKQNLKKKRFFFNKNNISILPKSFNFNWESPWNINKKKQILLKKNNSSKFIKKYKKTPIKQDKTPLILKNRITRFNKFKNFKFKLFLEKTNNFKNLYSLQKYFKFISKFIKYPYYLKKKINQLKINNKKKKETKLKFLNFIYKNNKKKLKFLLKKFNKYFYMPKNKMATLTILKKLHLLNIKYKNFQLKLNKFQLNILKLRSNQLIFNKLKLLKFKLNKLKKKLKELKKLNGLKIFKKKLRVILKKLKKFIFNLNKFKKFPSRFNRFHFKSMKKEYIPIPNENRELSFMEIKKLREGLHKNHSHQLKKFHKRIILKKKQKLLTPSSFVLKKKNIHEQLLKIKSNLEFITHSKIKILIRPARKKYNIPYNPSYLAQQLANTLKNPRNKRKFVFLYYQLYRNLKSISLKLQERHHKTKKIKGFRMKYAGKLWSKGRSKKKLVYHGPVALQNINEMLDYHFIRVITKYGVTGFKIWFNYYPRANHANIGKKSIIRYKPYLYLLNHKKKLYYMGLLLYYYKNKLINHIMKKNLKLKKKKK